MSKTAEEIAKEIIQSDSIKTGADLIRAYCEDRWISVEDGLPGRECLALDKDGEQWVGSLWITEGWVVVCEFANPNGKGTCKVMNITHYQPLPSIPSPPKQK